MAPQEAITIIIVDDHPNARENLRALLGDEPTFNIIAETDNAASALALIHKNSPDIALIDTALPGMSAIDAAKVAQREKLPTKFVLLVKEIDDNLFLQDTVAAGVMGYLLKDVSKAELIASLKSANRGAPVFHPDIQKLVLQRTAGEHLPHDDLTPRELDILKEVAAGKSNKAIASELNLTEGTVKGYVSVMLSKLGVDGRTQAAIYAVQHSLSG